MENDQNQDIDYAAVLADLLARRDALDKAIEAVRPLAGQTATKSTTPNVGVEIKSDSFFGLSIPDAIRKLLNMKKKPLTPAEVANYLEEGGVTHSSVNFVNTVGSVLSRLAKSEVSIVQVKRGQYGLIEWYPGYRKKNGGKKGEEKTDGESENEAADLA